MQAKFSTDEKSRDLYLELARIDIDAMELMNHGSAAATFAQWVEIKAPHVSRRAALHYFERARSEVQDFVKRQGAPDGDAWLNLSNLERARCRVLPDHCNPGLAQFAENRALALTPNLRREK
jgi:hypothetical protein